VGRRSFASVVAGGGTFAMGPREVPGGDHVDICEDPRAAEFALVGNAGTRRRATCPTSS
jgi:predicted enzyme related to lactoylglutathione lyase